ncbi:putative UNC 50 family [Trypanosoma vivax]|nr:hypothetical protein TRVL_03587 [Trypanosoma vivax]KAH8604136.1 putative UNC 50 family [Trypanosoma vivax]
MVVRRFALTSRLGTHIPEYVKRAFQFDQMELDSALSQMYSLCVNPSIVSKMSKARKMTKNHYHRDDPGLVVLQIVALVFTVAAYGLALRGGPFHIFYNILYTVIINYLLSAVVMATSTWLFAKHFMLNPSYISDAQREMDWQYSFDVHCNGYFPYFVWTKAVHYVFLPLVLQDSFLARLVGNSLHLIGCSLYIYVVFLGYLELPSLTQQQKIMYPVPLLVVLMVFITLFTNWSLSQWSLRQMWSV